MANEMIAILIGTRPGIIKMAPLCYELEKRNLQYILIHSGQHYSIEMDRNIMSDIGLKDPDFQIIRPEQCESHAQQTAYMLVGLEEIILQNKISLILVCGDANTNLAGALAARKIHVKVGHVEAGLRSRDWRMPEEHNRIIIDHISEFLFAPSEESKQNIIEDGVQGKTFVVGNTIVDTTLRYANEAKMRKSVRKIVEDINKYGILTLHREENVDNRDVLINIIQGLTDIQEKWSLPLVFPLHPRTAKQIRKFDLTDKLYAIKNIKIINPLGYLDFIGLLANASFVLTDSGGVQEESCILKIPCVTLRNSTERPETIKVGSNILVGTEHISIFKEVDSLLNKIEKQKVKFEWVNPFGDGFAAKRIIDVCLYGKTEEFKGYV